MKNRAFIFFAAILIVCSCSTTQKATHKTGGAIILDKSEESITFVVDENLPIPESHLKYPAKPEFSVSHMLQDYTETDMKGRLAACSFQGETFYGAGQKAFFEMMIKAYADHRPLVLSPDAIWMLISQGFSNYVNQNPETLRGKFVDFEGKLNLVVQTNEDLFSGKADWDAIINGFADTIEKNTKGTIANTMTADFSTTGPDERIASQVILMDVVKPYFEYVVMYIVCGIPHITLKGSPKDWESILERTKKFEKYGLGWWTEQLVPVLEEFVRASKGHPDQAFWKDIVCKVRPDKIRGIGCMPDKKNKPTEFDGWFLNFFPFDKNGRTPSKVRMDHEMLPEQARVPFRYITVSADGNVVETPMELLAGIIGYQEDTTNFALSPLIGWAAYKTKIDEDVLNELKKQSADPWGISIRVKEVPEVLRNLKHIKALDLTFTGDIVLPDWMDEIIIDRLVLHGKANEIQQREIKERFPDCVIYAK